MSAQKLEEFMNDMVKLDPQHRDQDRSMSPLTSVRKPPKKKKNAFAFLEKRQHKRYKPFRGLRCDLGQIHDMSISGIRVENRIEKMYQPTQHVELKFVFDNDDEDRQYFVQGEIMWVTLTWDNRQHLGIKFHSLADVFQFPANVLSHLGIPEDKLTDEYLKDMRMKVMRYKGDQKKSSWLRVMEGLCPEDD